MRTFIALAAVCVALAACGGMSLSDSETAWCDSHVGRLVDAAKSLYGPDFKAEDIDYKRVCRAAYEAR